MSCTTRCVCRLARRAADPDNSPRASVPPAPPSPTPRVPGVPMAINLVELRARPLDPEVEDELARFERAVEQYLAGEIDDDVFRVVRLNQGIYGQRQGGHNQMLRVK